MAEVLALLFAFTLGAVLGVVGGLLLFSLQTGKAIEKVIDKLVEDGRLR